MKNWIITLAAETEDNIYYTPVTIAHDGQLVPVQSTSDAFTMDGYEMATDLIIAYGELNNIEITLPSGYNKDGNKPGLFITLMERSEWAAMPRLREEYEMVTSLMAKYGLENDGVYPLDVEMLTDLDFIKMHAESELYQRFESERFGENELERMGDVVVDWSDCVAG